MKKELQEKNNFTYRIPYYSHSNPIENFLSRLKTLYQEESPMSYSDMNKVIERAMTK